MSNKKNLPNIPIYIGDWERDCNVLSLEAEAAWMRIVFKLWTKGKQNSIKLPTKSLQNLWRCSGEKINEILDELVFNEIAEITVDDRFVEFTCRRFVKENKLSEIRSNAGKSAKKSEQKPSKEKSKPNQNSSKNKTKTKQTPENEIDYEDENVIENKNEVYKKPREKKNSETELKIPWETENFKTQWQHWKVYKKKEFGFKFKSLQSEQAALTELANKSGGDEKTAIKIIHQSMANGWRGFFELKQNQNGKGTNNGKSRVRYSESFMRKIATGLQS